MSFSPLLIYSIPYECALKNSFLFVSFSAGGRGRILFITLSSFKDFNKRIGIYFPPPISIALSLPDAHKIQPFLNLRRAYLSTLKKKVPCRIHPETQPQTIFLLATGWGRENQWSKKTLPNFNPDLEDWIDDLKGDLYKGAPPNFNDGAGPLAPLSYLECSHSSSERVTSQGAPSVLDETNLFDEDTYEFSVSPEASPTTFGHWDVSDSEIGIEWKKYEECNEIVKKCCKKEQGKFLCVGMLSSCSDEEIKWSIKYYDMEASGRAPLVRCTLTFSIMEATLGILELLQS